MPKHLYPRGTDPAQIPPFAEGVSWDEWFVSLPRERLIDRDAERRLLAQKTAAAQQKTALDDARRAKRKGK
ncbi:MAG: hypothetical protein QM757_26600 [Paludibaculum sp.]